jgi:hypothetical protein
VEAGVSSTNIQGMFQDVKKFVEPISRGVLQFFYASTTIQPQEGMLSLK